MIEIWGQEVMKELNKLKKLHSVIITWNLKHIEIIAHPLDGLEM